MSSGADYEEPHLDRNGTAAVVDSGEEQETNPRGAGECPTREFGHRVIIRQLLLCQCHLSTLHPPLTEQAQGKNYTWRQNRNRRRAEGLCDVIAQVDGHLEFQPRYTGGLCGSTSDVRIPWDAVPAACDPLR
jgi:hypothetical protein